MRPTSMQAKRLGLGLVCAGPPTWKAALFYYSFLIIQTLVPC